MSLAWDSDGVTVAPAKAAAAGRRLSHAEVATLTNYEAQALGLPPFMEAVVVLNLAGRIDVPEFRIEHGIEPFDQMHAWTGWHRTGALLFVGERMLRLRLRQWQVLESLREIAAAGADVAARLRAWPKFIETVQASASNQVLVTSDLPHLRVSFVERLPPEALTRVGPNLQRIGEHSASGWAMAAGRRYYLIAAAV